MDVYDMCIDTSESTETLNTPKHTPTISERDVLPPISQLPSNSRQYRLHQKYQIQYQLQHRFLRPDNDDIDNDTQEIPVLPPLNNNITNTTTDAPPIEFNKLFKQVNEGCTTIYQQIGKYRDAPLREAERNQIIDDVYSTAERMLKLLEELQESEQDTTTTIDTQTTSEDYKLIRQARNLQKNHQPKYRRRSQRNAMIGHRCHSCNTTETPEWRRGPDGARTLCNACGLHYAKLVKKGSVTVQTHNYTLEAPPDIKPSRQYPIIQVSNDNKSGATSAALVQSSQFEPTIMDANGNFNIKGSHKDNKES